MYEDDEGPEDLRGSELGTEFSDKILFWPDGSIDVENLEDILSYAKIMRLKPSDKIGYQVHSRVPDFIEDAPELVNVEKEMTYGSLRRLYKRVTGRNFDFEVANRQRVSDAVHILTPSGLVDIGS